jgi:uncharacterized membrane protein
MPRNEIVHTILIISQLIANRQSTLRRERKGRKKYEKKLKQKEINAIIYFLFSQFYEFRGVRRRKKLE